MTSNLRDSGFRFSWTVLPAAPGRAAKGAGCLGPGRSSRSPRVRRPTCDPGHRITGEAPRDDSPNGLQQAMRQPFGTRRTATSTATQDDAFYPANRNISPQLVPQHDRCGSRSPKIRAFDCNRSRFLRCGSSVTAATDKEKGVRVLQGPGLSRRIGLQRCLAPGLQGELASQGDRDVERIQPPYEWAGAAGPAWASHYRTPGPATTPGPAPCGRA